MFKVPNMEDGEGELDVCIMTDTIRRIQPTRLAERVLLARSLFIFISLSHYRRKR